VILSAARYGRRWKGDGAVSPNANTLEEYSTLVPAEKSDPSAERLPAQPERDGPVATQCVRSSSYWLQARHGGSQPRRGQGPKCALPYRGLARAIPLLRNASSSMDDLVIARVWGEGIVRYSSSNSATNGPRAFDEYRACAVVIGHITGIRCPGRTSSRAGGSAERAISRRATAKDGRHPGQLERQVGRDIDGLYGRQTDVVLRLLYEYSRRTPTESACAFSKSPAQLAPLIHSVHRCQVRMCFCCGSPGMSNTGLSQLFVVEGVG
ncbi:uncharacterized protein B0H18DRAFT_964967, partial [Fomitopsis serialis]|uniref:uncharacterized protein n=1 Tax=Fomitopsis serialis TaxID=139415 RepID=UPI002008B611